MNMSRKKIFLFALLGSFLIVSNTSSLDVDFYIVDVTPNQVEPGQTLPLNVTLKNLGVSYAIYLKSILDPYDTSPIDPIGPGKIYLGSAAQPLASQEYFGVIKQSEEVLLLYQIHVDKNTTIGTYNIPLKLEWEDKKLARNNETLYFGIEVVGEADLRIASVNSSPSRVYPDTDFTLYLKIENIGKQDAKSAKINLLLPDVITGDYASFIGTVKRDESSTATFELRASKEAKPKAYNTDMEIMYRDEEGVEHLVKKNFDIFVHERGEVNLEIAGVSTSPTKIYPGSDFTLSVQLENIGTQDAKSVVAQVSPPDEFIGERSSFVGKIEVDDVSSGIFDMRISKKAKTGAYKVPITIVYTDESGIEYTEEKLFEIFVYKSPRKWLSVPVALAGIGIIILALYFWRRRRVEV